MDYQTSNSDGETARKAFNYELFSNEGKIRLLVLQHGTGKLLTSVTDCRIDSGTRYEALSYAWGDTSNLKCEGNVRSSPSNPILNASHLSQTCSSFDSKDYSKCHVAA